MTTTASWYHLSVKPVSRSAGRSVVAAAAYRLGARLEDERAQIVHDYRRRSGVEASFTVAPADAPAWAFEPERLWNAAERAEVRKNSTLAREVELALPAAVEPGARRGITEAFAEELVNRYGVAVSVAIHHPSAEGDDRNHHAHILFTTRVMEAEGLGAKTRVLDDRTTGPEEVRYLRGYACDLINGALADAESDERVDHRSFAARGIDQEPTTHLGPSASEIERRGVESDRGDVNREVEERNAQRQTLDILVTELAALDAEIAAELAAEFVGDDGPAVMQEDVVPETTTTLSAALVADTIADEEARISDSPGAMASSATPGASPPASQAVAPPSAFDLVHQETVQVARLEQDAIAQGESSQRRVDRVRAWWSNLCGHFGEWREQLAERAESYGVRWPWGAQDAAGVGREAGPSDPWQPSATPPASPNPPPAPELDHE